MGTEEIEQQRNDLYVPQAERDSCGVGLMANLKNNASHYVLDSALKMLENMEHRGACGCEANTGDGAGILTQIPHQFFEGYFQQERLSLPEKGGYGIAMIFFPKEKAAREACRRIIKKNAEKWDIEILHTREVPVDNSDLGDTALSGEPVIEQMFFKADSFYKGKALEKRLYILRSSILKKVYETYPSLNDDFYISSFSSKTIVYKGLFTAQQLRTYYKDLQDPTFKTAVAVVHSRFSTNTVPKWKLAQPFRYIAHNGEINTIQGNINWWRAREKHMELKSKDRPYLIHISPLCDPYISDSGNFDNVVDFLLNFSGRSVPRSLMMMIPEAWQNDEVMDPMKKAFYEYHEALIEPWEGPASICFTDGTLVGATLDRNGLRPSRYTLTSDDFLIVASEAGTIPVNPEKIVENGRLQPGKILVADLEEGRMISDKEVKEIACQKEPYQQWLNDNRVRLEDIPNRKALKKSTLSIQQQQVAFGFSQEDEKLILKAMAQNAKEPIGSMGLDTPLAILSKHPQHIANYFKQQFAQVTNPPIDSIRENYYMSLSTCIGGGSQILYTGEEQAQVIRCQSPILTQQLLANMTQYEDGHFSTAIFDIVYRKEEDLEQKIRQICDEVVAKIKEEDEVICLSTRNMDEQNLPIPSLMMTGALHHTLIKKGLRKEVAIVLDVGDVWETHHAALLLSFGADLISPYLAIESVEQLAEHKGLDAAISTKNYIKALENGILKIMSKLGIATLASYKGAQTFEALGIHQEVVNYCFKGTVSRIGGMRFGDIHQENLLKHQMAFSTENAHLPHAGVYQWRKTGEAHLFTPTSIHLLQYSTQSNQYNVYKKFADEIDKVEKNASTLRSFLRIKKGRAISIDDVESVTSLLKRFATGAMSFGSLSHEAHSTLAIAMNRIGAKSNSGEGGENPERYEPLPNGDSMRSAIKQVASGRFGVNIHYLASADEIQIKIAQGAKPGEGGHLPGHKVNLDIASVRNSTPGVGLISPPPHHDIYSIEDLAQLIFDLKNANPSARISVKLVAKAGVGVIASGVTKAHADHILISGHDGGTGASPLSSLRHAGIPWEIGLAETHQTLVKNGLRDRVVLQADGQIRTGRDLAIATILGAEEWGVATAALVVEGCILMRKCHLNTCPVGVATQDKELRKKFKGKADHIVNYFYFLAQHLREIMASVGVKTVNELVGRTDLLAIQGTSEHWKTKNLNLEPLLARLPNMYNCSNFAIKDQDHGIEMVMDRLLYSRAKDAIENGGSHESLLPIQSTDRAVGTMLSHKIAQQHKEGLVPHSLKFKFVGSAGQTFGGFGIKGLLFQLEGEANDYFGKGLSGATISVRPNKSAKITPEDNVIIGNVALYGAITGEAYINGIAGDRFAVRNSGASVVVEGVGANGCEYMTGGRVYILGDVGRNFAAGMSGGIAYLYDHVAENNYLINQDMVLLEKPTKNDLKEIKVHLEKHIELTSSPKAKAILKDWQKNQNQFTKVFPIEYKKVLESGYEEAKETSIA